MYMMRASARYRGRIEADLDLSDIVLLVRDPECGGDGSVVIYKQSEGVTPVNWMPAGSQITRNGDDFHIRHAAREESLDVYVQTIYSSTRHAPTLTGAMSKVGVEREMSDLLSQQTWRFGEKVVFVAREHPTSAGPIDVFCTEYNDGAVGAVIIEAKRVSLSVSHVYQARRYADAVAVDEAGVFSSIRAVLAAPGCTRLARALLADNPDISFLRVDYATLKQWADEHAGS